MNSFINRIIQICTGLLLFAVPAAAQVIQLKSAQNGTPLDEEVYVMLGTKAGTKPIVNFYGSRVDISAFDSNDTLLVKAFGFKPLQIPVQTVRAGKLQWSMEEMAFNTAEVVVSASKFLEKREDVPQQIRVIGRNEISHLNQPTTAELLQNTGSAFVQKSQMGGGSPVLRGFEASRILIVIDGVRMNNAIFRAGHLQNVLRVDQAILSRAEIVYGPGSVIYGSDALGGVIHFQTRNPVLATTGQKRAFHGGAYLRYGTAQEEKSGHLNWSVGGRKLAWLSSITFSDFGDQTVGTSRNPAYGNWGQKTFLTERVNGRDTMLNNNNPNKMVGSGYWQMDVLQKLLFQQSRYVSHLLNLQYSTTSNVPRYDRLMELRNGKPRSAEWYYGPEQRLMASYQLRLSRPTLLYNNLVFTAAFQNILESRYDRGFQNPNRSEREEQVDVYSLNLDAEKNFRKQEIRYGLEATYNQVNSVARSRNVDTDALRPLSTRYPDGGSQYQSWAAYLTHTWEINEQFLITEGIRYSYVGLDARFVDKQFYSFLPDKVSQKNGALTGKLGGIWKPGKGWMIQANLATGFRAPNVDDLVKIFDSQSGVTLILPNPDLKPEYVYSGELAVIKRTGDLLEAEVNAYYSMIQNLMTVRPTRVNGSDSILYDGNMTRVASMQNADQGWIYGASYRLRAQLSQKVNLYTSLAYTYGRIATDSAPYPMDHIPPVYGQTGLQWVGKNLKLDFYALYNGWKRLKDYNLNGEDNQQYATPWGTPAWITLNARGAINLYKGLLLQLAVENILDSHYRYFASGISAPGRNLSATLRYKF